MIIVPLHDRVHRVVKLAIDSRQASSLEEATALFRTYRLMIHAGPDVARSAPLQAALLTAVNTGRRCFLGGVEILTEPGTLNSSLMVPWLNCPTLGSAVEALGGALVSVCDPNVPQVVLGDVRAIPDVRTAIRATMNGWSAGVAPVHSGLRLEERQECTTAGVLAGALAVSEAFQFVRGDTIDAGDRAVGLSLWDPSPEADWLTTDPGPALDLLPSRLWLIGLGHLGQSYLWTLGLLPYANARLVELVLHDFDMLTEANDSTSPLTFSSIVGSKKTRAMAAWAEQRGFRSVIIERRFAGDFRVSDSEPRLALCGVDNALARAALEDVGFERVVETGLGKGTHEYLAMQLHTFPSCGRSARARWGSGISNEPGDMSLLDNPAYRRFAAEGLDECGLTTLAGRSVGAPFVGVVASTLAIAETIRMCAGESTNALVDMTLRAPHRRRVVRNHDLPAFNPGFTQALP